MARADKAGGLVEGDVNFPFDAHRYAGDGDAVCAGLNLGSQSGHRLAVDVNLAGGNERLTMPARPEAGFREQFLEADEHLFGLGLGQSKHALPILETTFLLQDFNALETLHHVAFRLNFRRTTLETLML